MARTDWAEAALLLAGHGLADHPDGALATKRHADSLRARGLFADVRVGFLRQEPELAATLAALTQPRVYVVPMLASKGYIADVVMAGRLNLAGPATWRIAGGREQEVCFCDPVGTHPDIPALLGRLIIAECHRRELAPEATDVILVGHGTPRNPRSSSRTREVADALSKSGVAGRVQAMFLDEDPLIDGWKDSTTAGNVIVAPFLFGNWYHASEDLPRRIGPPVAERQIWYLKPLGEEPEIADLALAMVEKFETGRGCGQLT